MKKTVVFLEVDEPAAEAHSVNLFWRIWVQAGRQARFPLPVPAGRVGLCVNTLGAFTTIFTSQNRFAQVHRSTSSLSLSLIFCLFPLSLVLSLYHTLSLSNPPPSLSFILRYTGSPRSWLTPDSAEQHVLYRHPLSHSCCCCCCCSAPPMLPGCWRFK